MVRDSTGGVAFDFNLTKTIDYLSTRVLDGTYRPQIHAVVESAKSRLLRRQLSFLSTEDALVLGSLIHAVRPSLVTRMPVWVSFGRADTRTNTNTTPSRFDYEGWWVKWLRYRNLLKVIEDDPNPLLVTSDIVNFFGSVDLSLLRSKITGVPALEAQANDLLFYLLDRLLPSYDYRPRGLFGLPVVAEDTSRTLAHYYLLDLDSVLSDEGEQNRYTRWVDDLVVSVPNREEGVRVVTKVENALASLGLVANSSKTEIISKDEFRARHYIDENDYLDFIHEETDTCQNIDKKVFHENLSSFLNSTRGGYYARILSRYYTESRRSRSKQLLGHWDEHLKEFPSNAQHILDYVSFFEGTFRYCAQVFEVLKTHGTLFEDIQLLMYESLLLRPFPDDRILRSYVLHQSYLHYIGSQGFRRPSSYVRAIQALVMFKFGGRRASKLISARLEEEAVESPLYATYAFPIVASDPNLRPMAYQAIEHIEDPQVLRVRALIERLVEGDQRATKLLRGFLDPKKTKLPTRHVLNSRALPLLKVARTSANSASSGLLRQATNNATRKLQIADCGELIDWIAISHL